MKSVRKLLNNQKFKNGIAIASAPAMYLASQAAFAIDAETQTAIETAQTGGQTAVASTVSGLVGIVAGVVGVLLVISILKKA